MKEVHDNDEDIYDDLDSLFSQAISHEDNAPTTHPTVSNCINLEENVRKDENNLLHSATSSPNQNFILNEDDLKETEMNLYLDLLTSEMKNKNTIHTDPEFIKIQKELTKVQDAAAEKDKQIEKLTNEVITLKKNICSLYKTAKTEIDQKDRLLQDCNRKIDILKTRLLEDSMTIDYRSNSTQSEPNRINFVQNRTLYKNDNPDYMDQEQSYEGARTETTSIPIPSTSYKSSERVCERNTISSKEKNHVHVLKKQKLSYTDSYDICKDDSDYEQDEKNDLNMPRTFSNHISRTNLQRKNSDCELKKQRLSCSPSRNYSHRKPANDYKRNRREHFSYRHSDYVNKINSKRKHFDNK